MSSHSNLKHDDPSIIQCTTAGRLAGEIGKISSTNTASDGRPQSSGKKPKSNAKFSNNEGNARNHSGRGGINSFNQQRFSIPPDPTRMHHQSKNGIVNHPIGTRPNPRFSQSGGPGYNGPPERHQKKHDWHQGNGGKRQTSSHSYQDIVYNGLPNGVSHDRSMKSDGTPSPATKSTHSLENIYRGKTNSGNKPKNGNDSKAKDTAGAMIKPENPQGEEQTSRNKPKKKRGKKNKSNPQGNCGTQLNANNKQSNTPGQTILSLVNKNAKLANSPSQASTKTPSAAETKSPPIQSAQTSGTSSNTGTTPKSAAGNEIVAAVAANKTSSEPGQTDATDSDVKDKAADSEPEKPVKVEDKAKLEEMGMQQAETRLVKDYVFTLEKRSSQFPAAKFLCKLCNYHLDSVILAHRHIKEKRHKKLWKERKQDEMLRQITIPPQSAIDALQRLLVDQVLRGSVLTDDDLKVRRLIVQNLDQLIQKKFKGSQVVMYGSSLSGLGFKTSNINVDLQYPSSVRAPNALLRVLDILEHSGGAYCDVNPDFRAKIPRIEFTDSATRLQIRLSTGNEFAVNTTRLLRFYAALDPRVAQLSMVFRSWAQICRLDRQHEGSMPQHAFVIMAIFFMQKHEYLPVLREVISDHDMNEIFDKSMNCSQLVRKGDSLWYLPTHPPASGGRPTINSNDVTEDSDSDTDPDSVIVSRNESGTSPSKGKTRDPAPQLAQLKPVELMGRCRGREIPLARLWLDMLKFYALEYPVEEMIISIRHSGDIRREERSWGKKRVAVLDPFSTKRNLCRSMSSQNVFSYMVARLKAALIYFHADPSEAAAKAKAAQKKSDVTEKSPSPTVTSPGACDDVEAVLVSLVADVVKMSLEEIAADKSSSTQNDDVHSTDCSESNNDQVTPANTDSSTTQADGCALLGEYRFTRETLTGGDRPVVVCGLCKKEGHPREKCPDEIEQHHLEPLAPMTPQLREMLDRVCRAIMGMYRPTADEVKRRQQICTNLSRYLQRTFNSHCVMQLFGSSRNGFGFKGSDLDICLTFDDNRDGQGLDFVSIIEEVTRYLRRCQDLRAILPITTAKVPIVKFEHLDTRLEGDISLYNLLAQRNTLMLSAYADVDERCRILGYVTKAFVKRCHIGDASRGSLSSYAYTLMVIFYLQQKERPVLPVLQQLGPNPNQEEIVDGWNSWFYGDINKLEEVWPELGGNSETVGELWHGMLRFYTEEFDFKKHVISIRQKKPLTTFEKEWTSKFISIEDPFDLNHNLGAGVSRKMTNFIMRVFVKARQHFGTAPKAQLNRLNEVNYFFDAEVLMDGEEAPNDRCCRICGKIGHFVRTCPKSRRRRRDPDNDEDPMNDVTCFYCGERGHIKKDCPVLNGGNNQRTPNRRHMNMNSDSPQMGMRGGNNRNSPMPRRQQHTPGRMENRRNGSSDQSTAQSPAEHKNGRVNKRLVLEPNQSSAAGNPDSQAREDAARKSRSRKNSNVSSTPNQQKQPSPSIGFRVPESPDSNIATPPRNNVQSRPVSAGQWSPFSPQPMRLNGPPGPHMRNQARPQRYPAVGSSPQKISTLSQVESQIFHNSAQERARKLSESGSNSEPPSPRSHFGPQHSPSIAVVPAAPILGLGLRIPAAGGPSYPHHHPHHSQHTPPSPFSPGVVPPFPYGRSPDGGSPQQHSSIHFPLGYGHQQSPRNTQWSAFYHGNA